MVSPADWSRSLLLLCLGRYRMSTKSVEASKTPSSETQMDIDEEYVLYDTQHPLETSAARLRPTSFRHRCRDTVQKDARIRVQAHVM